MKTKTGMFCFSLILILFVTLYAGSSDISICKEAVAPEDYGAILEVPDSLRILIGQYRLAWKELCSGRKDADRSLSRLLSQAEQIESQFKTVIAREDKKFQGNDASKERFEHANRVHEILGKQYPAFIPGFHGSYMEYSFFRPSLKKFDEAAQLGNDEDRAFFGQYANDGIFRPWIMATWDYGGCRRYGQFKWAEQLQTALDMRTRLKSKVYLDINSEFVKEMLRDLTQDWDVCTCDRKESVLPDLVSVSDFLKGKAEFEPDFKAVNEKIQSIRSGKIKVNSEAEKHCSGG